MEPIDLSEFMTTKAEANDFLTRINAVSEKLFQTNFNLHKTLTEQFGVTKTDKFLSLLLNNNINAESLPAVKDFLKKLQEQVTGLPVLSITIAFEPSKQTLTSLSEWFLVNIKKQMLFDITIDKRLVAGATINYNGKHLDFSIRPIFIRLLNNTLHSTTNTPPPVQNTQQTQQPIKIPVPHPTQPQQQPVPPSSTGHPLHQQVEVVPMGR